MKKSENPYINAPTTSSSPKKLATLPTNGVEYPRILNPKIISKKQSNITTTKITDQIKKKLLIKSFYTFEKFLNYQL